MMEQMKINSIEKTDGFSGFVKKQILCEFCGKEREQLTWEYNNTVRYLPSYKDCSCEMFQKEKVKQEEIKRQLEEHERKLELERRNQEKIKNLFGNSGMSKRALGCRFEGYQLTLHNTEAVRTCNNYVDRFNTIKNEKRNGLFLVGNCGVGKSHLAYAVANALIEQKTSVIAMTMIDLLLKLKSSYRTDEENEEKVLKVYEDCSLLIIDDLGKEKPTEWALQMIYAIIDRRYNSLKPIIVTTNYNAEELIAKFTIGKDSSTGRAIVDRLFEMCHYLPIKGESYRKR